MAKIQYNTKKLRVNTPPTPEELFSFNDANEIKASVNFLYDNGADGKFIQATPTEPQAESIVLKKAIDGEDDMILRVSADSVSMKGGMFNQVAWNGALYPHYKEAYLNPDGIGFKTIDKAAETIVGSGYWNSTGFGFDGDGGHAYFNHRGVGASNSQGSYRSGLEGIYFGQSGNGTGYHGGTGMGSSNSFGGVHAAIGSISSSIYGVGNLYHTLESIGINANAGSVSLEKNKLSFYPSGQPTFDNGSIIPNNIGRYDVVTPESFLAVTGTTTLTLPSEGGTIARIEDLPTAPDLTGYVKLQQMPNVAPQVGNILVNGAIAISDGLGTEVSLSGQGFTSFSPDGLVLISPSTITIQNLDFMNPVGAGISSRGLNIFNGQKTFWLEPNQNSASGQIIYTLPLTSGELALKTDIPAAPDLSTYISMYGFQEQTGYLTLKNWLTFKKINSWQNSTNAGNLSYSDTHRWVFMSSSDSTKNVGFEILPSETRTVIRLTLPTTGGTIARLEDLPNTANFATLNGYNTFTANNAFNGYTNFQGASFQGDVNVNSGKRTTLGGGVDVYQDLSIYSGVGRITMSAAYMGTNQSHAITVPANSGTLALISDLNAYLRLDDISSYINLDGKTNKTETLSVGATQRNFEANSNNGFRFGITNDQYMGDTNAGMNNFSVAVGSEKREAGYGNLERGKKLSLTHYADGFIFNQYSAPKNNQLAIAFPDFGTTDSTGAHLYFPASVSDGTLTVLSNVTTAPTSANSTGVKGEVIIASGYRYECISANTWVRSAVETSW